MSSEVIMMAKYPKRCSECGYNIETGEFIKLNIGAKTANHVKRPVQGKAMKEGKND